MVTGRLVFTRSPATPATERNVIELNGATHLTDIANHYYLYDNTDMVPR